jgi:hypothetical protein
MTLEDLVRSIDVYAPNFADTGEIYLCARSSSRGSDGALDACLGGQDEVCFAVCEVAEVEADFLVVVCGVADEDVVGYADGAAELVLYV